MLLKNYLPQISKFLVLFVITSLLSFTSCQSPAPQEKEEVKMEAAEEESGFDQALAEKYGADEYGMKKYAIVLKTPKKKLNFRLPIWRISEKWQKPVSWCLQDPFSGTVS